MGYSYGFKLFGGGGAGGSGVGTSSTTQVLFNSSGSVAGDAGLTYDSASDTLTTGALVTAAGSITAPSINMAGGTFGAYRTASGYWGFVNSAIAAQVQVMVSDTGVFVKPGNQFGFASTADYATGTPDSGFRRVSAGLVGVTSGGSNLGSLQAGNLTATALETPVATITNEGTAGAATGYYTVTAYLNDGTSSLYTAVFTAASNAALDGTNFNRLTWPAVPGAAYYKAFRYAHTFTPVTSGTIYTGTATTVDDTGLAGDGNLPPTTNTTGRVLVGDGSFGNFAYGFSGDVSAGLSRGPTGQLFFGAGGANAYWYGDATFNIPYDVGAFTLGTSRDAWITRGPAAATLQLGKAPNASPVANTLIVGESGAGTNIAGANGVISSGIGTGSGTVSSLFFQTPTPGSSGASAQSPANRLQIKDYTAIFFTKIEPANGDTLELGWGGGGEWKNLYLSRATLGSKSKALTDGSATDFATFTIADGEQWSGEIIYAVRSVDGTNKQITKGRVQFTASREGTDYDFDVSEIGTPVVSAKTGTLTGAISINCTGGVCTLSANFNSSQTTPVLTGSFRFDSTDAGLALTFP